MGSSSCRRPGLFRVYDPLPGKGVARLYSMVLEPYYATRISGATILRLGAVRV